MKTYSNVFSQIISWDNLLSAAFKASKGKRFDPAVTKFHIRLESEILKLQQELRTQQYQPGAYKSFMIYDPKERMISAAPFRDRVVHHALCNVIEPIFDNTFIYDSYANRKGKGAHRAIERFQHYARKYSYVLKSDIRKFFPSLDHEVLKQEIRWKITCPQTLWLVDLIIDNSNEQEQVNDNFFYESPERRRGLPIGNLTSQFWANVYLNRFDHFIKEELRVPGYVRYVDDFVLFNDSKTILREYWRSIESRIQVIRLNLHPKKTHIHKIEQGVPFLGYHVYPHWRIVKKSTVRRYRRYIGAKLSVRTGDWPSSLEKGLNSWLGHIRYGQHFKVEKNVFSQLCSQGINVVVHPNGSWRVLEYMSSE
ncbi:MAG: reverse transcriptase/maturase family protein [Bacteroidetes bacterium]|nr:reverse transcriptase/maturase family protein [Bacteroidota bacterium]